MKKIKITCVFSGKKSPVPFYIGAPKSGSHPIHFQADWLSKERGGAVPPEVMESLEKLHALSEKNDVSFEELCSYALNAASNDEATAEENSESNQHAHAEEATAAA